MSEEENISEFNRFLINNKDFLIQKYHQHFQNKSNITIKTIPIPPLIDYIYDIFSFNKYRKDQTINQKITHSLTLNIQQFITNNPGRETQEFTSNVAVEALTYCIKHNDMFSVQYDAEAAPKNRPVSSASREAVGDFNVNVDFGTNEHLQHFNQTLEGSREGNGKMYKSSSHKSIKKKDGNRQQLRDSHIGQAEGHEQCSNTEESEALRERQKKQMANQFEHNEALMKLKLNPDIIKKNAKIVYLNFCRHQMELGGQKTFDRLNEEASTMSIGKFLTYAKAYEVYSDIITKQILISRFKRISDGLRTIDFQKFYVLLTELQSMDSSLFKRIQLHDEHLHKKVKFVKFPFDTQDQNPREHLVYRNFTNKLTSHSGKTPLQLKEELNLRKIQHLSFANRSTQSKSYAKPMPNDKNRMKEKMLSPKDLSSGAKARDYSIDLSFIDKIVSPQDNDQKYLGQYQIQHYTKRMQDDILTSNPSSYVLRRKDSIVQNIRKRIQQIQHKEDNQQRKVERTIKSKYNYPV